MTKRRLGNNAIHALERAAAFAGIRGVYGCAGKRHGFVVWLLCTGRQSFCYMEDFDAFPDTLGTRAAARTWQSPDSVAARKRLALEVQTRHATCKVTRT